MADEIKVGMRCEVQGNRGIVKFHGTTAFAAGVWVGVELEEPVGKNDGSVKDQRYFTTQPNHGIFVRPSAVALIKEEPKVVPPPEEPVPAPTPVEAATPAPSRTAPPAATPAPEVPEAAAAVVPQTPLKAPAGALPPRDGSMRLLTRDCRGACRALDDGIARAAHDPAEKVR